jgi:hypothetical protein
MLKIDPLQRFTLEEINEFIHPIEDDLKGFRTILLMDSQAQENPNTQSEYANQNPLQTPDLMMKSSE